MIQCVPNVSEGRDQQVLAALADACTRSLIDWHADVDHNRSVFTFAGPGARDAEGAVRVLARAVAGRIDLGAHRGVHPRLGALDVVPFVALGTTTVERAQASEAAHSFARWWSQAFDVPCFMYDEADPTNRDLPSIRRGAFRLLRPDYGPSLPHAQLGATAVGARKPLVAINCMLVSREVEVANRIARAMRESSGGLPGVRALGFILAAADRAEVSMNLVDLDRTGVEEAVLHVRELARKERTDVAQVELVGLIPARELDRCSQDFLKWSGLDAAQTIEWRIAAANDGD